MNQFAQFRKPKRFIDNKLEQYSPRGLLLYVLPLALIPATVIALSKGHFWATLINASGFAGFMLAASLLRKGLRQERELLKNRLSNQPSSSLKLTAAVMVEITTVLMAWLGAGQSFFVALLYGAGAFLGMYLSYGFDAKIQRTVAAADGYSGQEIMQMLQQSAEKIRNIESANDKIHHTELNQRIERICQIADAILLEIEADPRDFRKSRKFLNVYLEGAQKVTEGYALTHKNTQSGELEQNFRNVLETIETVFQQQHEKLQEDDVFDLDVQIEVLNTQLKREGII